jgi:hypothetical protein
LAGDPPAKELLRENLDPFEHGGVRSGDPRGLLFFELVQWQRQRRRNVVLFERRRVGLELRWVERGLEWRLRRRVERGFERRLQRRIERRLLRQRRPDYAHDERGERHVSHADG